MCSCLLDESKIVTQLFEGRVIILNTVDSTNQYIMDNIQYVRSGDVVVTEYQTLGRGRFGKVWVAPFGKNICLSIYWRFNSTPTMMVAFSLMISSVVAKTLKNLGVSHIQIKWPNDLYVNERKLAGVLIEMITRKNDVTHLIIGIGINLSACMHEELKHKINNNWISLEDIGIILDRNILIAQLINMLRQQLQDVECYGLASFVTCWKNFDYLYKKSVILFTETSNITDGIAMGINERGALLVEQSNIIRYYIDNNISINVC